MTNTILVTGSSGYVASDLIPRLSRIAKVVGIDLVPSGRTDYSVDIASKEFGSISNTLLDGEVTIINLAAARFDFGASAEDYFGLNVSCQECFLQNLSSVKIKSFIHVSSVAAIDGRDIPYKADLSCDDAYRSTKYLQENLVRKWCEEREVELTVLYPSAIFSFDARLDTNIGKMQSISKALPFVPVINVNKSVTFLPKFSKFILDHVSGKLSSGSYLTIEKPVMSVTQLIVALSGKELVEIRIFGLRQILKCTAWALFVLGGFGKLDLKLTPNRVVKLFSDTSYAGHYGNSIDSQVYGEQSTMNLLEVLSAFNNEEDEREKGNKH
ncbi:NAD(P)-dependent oxidoreductase [Litorivicinus sp.]|nr:NAD(P)-dependent oxidoreductase [Litorivicinus sp.]